MEDLPEFDGSKQTAVMENTDVTVEAIVEGVSETTAEKEVEMTTETATENDVEMTTEIGAGKAVDPPMQKTPMHSSPLLRPVSDGPPVGHINTARRPAPITSRSSQSSGLTQDIQDKMKAFSLSRQGAPPINPAGAVMAGMSPMSPQGPMAGRMNPNLISGIPAVTGRLPGGIPAGLPAGARLPPPKGRPSPANWASSPAAIAGSPAPKMGGLAAKRGMGGGLKLSNAAGGPPSLAQPPAGSSAQAIPQLPGGSHLDSAFTKYSEIIDTKEGTINFKNQAVIHGKGIDFSSGQSFSMSLDDVESLAELGKGNYGTVYKVRRCKPRLRRPGLGLKGTMSGASVPTLAENKPDSEVTDDEDTLPNPHIMAMKEIHLELDDAKFTAIIMELDILHRCVSPFIIDFYGAFFQEGAVYICVEYMDGGSMEKLYACGIPECILRKIALSTVMGLKSLKDQHNIIHRDVKPTNILANSKGQVKICDFGVSGNLVASIAKTNIGCQSYMAPERISGGGFPGAPGGSTYSVQSDIWSLGLTLIECAIGRYPYPPETYNNIFSQLNAIVQGEPPQLPDEGFSDDAKDFVKSCLNKNPALRPNYATLIRHPWVAGLMERPIPEPVHTADGAAGPQSSDSEVFDQEVADWVREALERKEKNLPCSKGRPALHAVALDAVPTSPSTETPPGHALA
ncbi:hypothetical protein FQN57_000108 [Myotisia sp. PD_48]|nr:hypothetical protein FQN57_000108 [Myotisia sp. PD_48]